MEIYKKMYLKLFNAVSDALSLINKTEKAAKLLKEAQQTCEELYMSAEEERIATAPSGLRNDKI